MDKKLCALFLLLAQKALSYGYQPAYEFADTCLVIQSKANKGYLVKNKNQRYHFKTTDFSSAERFFAKATSLGHYLLKASDGSYLARRHFRIVASKHPGKNTEWSILKENSPKAKTAYFIATKNNRLKVGRRAPLLAPRPLMASNKRNELKLIKLDKRKCTFLPEASLNAVMGQRYFTKKDPKKPINGFADIHAHLAFPMTMGGKAMAGGVFHPYGIEHALGDCRALHGENGSENLLELNTSGSKYDTKGYPSFPHWPNRETATHVTAYYKWLQRAHLSGLKIITTFVTGNPFFCQVLSADTPARMNKKCSAMTAVDIQTKYMHDLENYIDAQEGGPGKGWLRIVKSPREARDVIADNKLAVVLGVEHGSLFDCTESNEGCTEGFIKKEVEKLYHKGIRSVFPMHRFDNAFGGTRLASGTAGAWMHLSSRLSTSKIDHLLDVINPLKLLTKPFGGQFWQVEDCPLGIKGTRNLKSMDHFLKENVAAIAGELANIPLIGKMANSILDSAFLKKLEPIPNYEDYQEDRFACNKKSLTNKGRVLLKSLMDKGMLIDVDHMSYYTMMEALELFKRHRYSGVISSHGWFDGSESTRMKILELGGQIATNGAPKSFLAAVKEQAKKMKKLPFLVSTPLGSDIQGIAKQAGSSHLHALSKSLDEKSSFTLNYPFKGFHNDNFFTPPKTGTRSFDFIKEGVAHYGLLAEWVHNLAYHDEMTGYENMSYFMNSAEAYIQTWERAYAFSKNN